jgi:hypothetical protein
MSALYRDLNLPVHQRWLELRKKLRAQLGKAPDLNAILLLIGVRELGRVADQFSKEEKQDLMHIATCAVLSLSGYYRLDYLDQDGWPHWSNNKPLPNLNLKEQEDFLKEHILMYFESMDY